MIKHKMTSSLRHKLLNQVNQSEALFEETIMTARYASQDRLTPEIKGEISYVRNEYKALKEYLEKSASAKDTEFIQERMNALKNRRAYVMPASDLSAEAHYRLDKLKSWKISSEGGLEPILEMIRKIDAPAVEETEKRMLMLKLYEVYDYWDQYLDWVNTRILWSEVILCLMSVIGLGFSIWFLVGRNCILGFIVAGACGASLSVLLKMPTIPVYEEFVLWYIRGTARFATGVVANVIGLGLLASGIINFSLNFDGNSLSIAKVIKGTEICLTGSRPFDTSILWGLALLSIGILFGFTERALASFESTLFGRIEKGEKHLQKKSTAQRKAPTNDT